MSDVTYTLPVKDDVITISPWSVARPLLQIVALLVVLDLFTTYLTSVLHLDTTMTRKLVRHFGLNEENNIPAFFSYILLLFASVLLFITAKQSAKRSDIPRWRLLGFVFLFLSLDESISIHEELTYTINHLYHSGTALNGYLRYSWVIPYMVALVFLVLFYARFIWQLPPSTRALFVVSGCIFVTGAVGLESVEGHFDYLYGMHNLYSSLLCTLEEVMEMGGVILFIYALLAYIAEKKGKIRFTVFK